ncbi:neuronal PAS domain-containing protein 4 isoform X1 [Diachasma alloeum]|uniref:neuronal PAS domain-containing protein 4 isoform X1 n=2 Tax=Diachasma alloeum TaxID=454923 RepID=UPI0007382C6A|nr:neuronal PAS domain-containing protein 4 isoform X1 [Diachasma alloeum]
MFNRIDASKSTKGASKLRRDLINAEIANLRDLLPLPPSTRQRLSQLQLMALVCVFLRKANYFQQALKNSSSESNIPTPNIGFSKAMSGFIMMMTQQGKLLYISENAAEYLGHSMEDLLIHGDSVYDVIDKQDHMVVQNQLARSGPMSSNDRRLFLCRINVSRNSRRQLRFGDQKVVLVEGHYLPFVPLCNRNEAVFLASCTPVVLPETRESVVQGATNIFTTIHSMDMKYLHIDKTAESHLEYSRSELVGVSWYNLLHWDCIRTAYCKHQSVIQSDQDRTSTALLRLQSSSGRWFWIHCVLQVKETSEECQHPIIVCTNQVLSDKEAEVMRSSTWLYNYSSQSKFTYGICPSTAPQQSHGLQYPETYPRPVLMQPLNTSESSPGSYDADYPAPSVVKVATGPEDIEPVDMSINSGDHEGRHLYQMGHHPSHHHHHHHQQQQQQHQGHHSQQHGRVMQKSGGYRGKLAVHYLQGRQYAPPDSPKYITDLDVSYGEACAERQSVHKRLIKVGGGMILEPTEPVDHWTSSPIWSDTLQRVPDVVHQDLSPYITTPSTPVDTPDSADLHSEVPVFNFDWSTEQHVPNAKIMVRRDLEQRPEERDSQPITLHLPRRKHQNDGDKDYDK